MVASSLIKYCGCARCGGDTCSRNQMSKNGAHIRPPHRQLPGAHPSLLRSSPAPSWVYRASSGSVALAAQWLERWVETLVSSPCNVSFRSYPSSDLRCSGSCHSRQTTDNMMQQPSSVKGCGPSRLGLGGFLFPKVSARSQIEEEGFEGKQGRRS